jgi:hypothetical protein
MRNESPMRGSCGPTLAGLTSVRASQRLDWRRPRRYIHGMRILAESEVAAWVKETLLASSRTRPIVAITSLHLRTTGWLDPEAMQRTLGELADVVFLATGEPTWALTETLPERLDVYGGAARIWWPGLDRNPDPLQHPLLFMHSAARAEEVASRIVSLIRQRAGVADSSPPEAVRAAGLVRGSAPPLPPRPPTPPKPPEPGKVTKISGTWIEVQAGALRGNIVESDLPLPLLASLMRVGCELTVRLLGIGERGPQFSLRGLTPNPWHRLMTELRPDEVVLGRVRNIDERIKLAFIDILPGVTARCHISEVDYGYVERISDFLPRGKILPFVIRSVDPMTLDLQVSRKRAHGHAPRPLPAWFVGGEPFVWQADTPEFENLHRTARDGQPLGPLILLRTVADAPVAPPTPPPDPNHEAIEALRAELTARDESHRNLVDQIRALKTQVQDQKREARAAEDRAEALQQQLRAGDAGSSERAFLAAVRGWYARTFEEDDRLTQPLQRMRVGREFLASIAATPGVELDKVVEVCGQIAAGIAHQVPGRDAHPLRAGSRGADGRTRKSDGAKAWRCALKQAPSAPRLHWWQTTASGGEVVFEFASVGLHDDMAIPE